MQYSSYSICKCLCAMLLITLVIVIIARSTSSKILRSRKYRSFSKAVIVGCARDIAYELDYSLRDMYSLGSEFDRFAIVVYENDSRDNTLQKLQNFAHVHRNVHIIHETNVLGARTTRLARGRNILLNYARSHYADYDFFIVMDMDYTRQNTCSLARVADNMQSHWSAVTAVSRTKYYDWWALRCKELNMHYDCHKDKQLTDDRTNKVVDIMSAEVVGNRKIQGNCKDWNRKFGLQMNHKLRNVQSAFNGIGIYKFNKIPIDAMYIGVKNGVETCEHVEFHKSLSQIYIDPKLVTSTWDPTILDKVLLPTVRLWTDLKHQYRSLL